jgi:hypothetical protein
MNFFRYSKLVWKQLGNISNLEVKDLHSKKEKGEKEPLGVNDLVNQSNEEINKYQGMLKKLPAQFSADLKRYIVNYFISSANRFDKDAERGLDKIEFGKYKKSMLSKLSSILSQYVPSQEQVNAHKEKKAKIERAAKKLEQQTLMKNDAFDVGNLTKPAGIQTELKKINSQSTRLQKDTKGGFDAAANLMQKVNEYNQLSAYAKSYGNGPQWKINMKIRHKPAAQNAKKGLLKAVKEHQKTIAKHGDELVSAGLKLKKKFMDARELAYEKVKGKANAKKKKNEKIYNLLKKKKERLDKTRRMGRPDIAIKKIDGVLNNPLKYGLTPDSIKKLIEQRRLLLQSTGGKTGILDLANVNAKKEIKGAMRILESHQYNYGDIKERIAAKFAPSLDRIDTFNEAIGTHILETNIDNLKVVSSLESSLDAALNTNLKGYSTYDAVTGGITGGIQFPFKVISATLSRARDIKYLGKVLGPVGDFVGGSIESVGDIASGFVGMVLHPVQAAKGIASLAGRNPETGEWHKPWNTDYHDTERAWLGVWRAMFSAEEFKNGQYAKGSGKIAGNFFTAVLTGGGVGSIRAVGFARHVGRTSARLGLKGSIKALGRGIKGAPAAAGRYARTKARNARTRVKNFGTKTVDIAVAVLGWNSKKLGQVGDIYKNLSPKVSEKLSGLRNSYNQFTAKVSEKVKAGRTPKEAAAAVAKENPSLYTRAKQYLSKLKEERLNNLRAKSGDVYDKAKVKGRSGVDKVKDVAGNAKNRVGEVYRNASASMRLKASSAVRAIMEWNTKKFGSVGDAYRKLTPKAREKLSGLRNSYRQFRDKVVEKVKAGRTPKEAAAAVAKENPSLYMRAKNYLKQLKENAGERIRGHRKAWAEKSRLRAEAKGVRAEARRASNVEAAKARAKAKINEDYSKLKFAPGDEIKIKKNGKIEDGWKISLDDGDMVVITKAGKTRRTRKSSILEHNKKGPTRKANEVKKAREAAEARAKAKINEDYSKLKFEPGDEIKIKQNGKIEDGWKIALDDGDMVVVTKGGKTRTTRKSSILEHNKKGPQRKADEVKKAEEIKKYKDLGFEDGDIVKVRRSEGPVEGGWRIMNRDPSDKGRVILHKEGVGTRATSYENILHNNPKGPRVKAKVEAEYNRRFKEGDEITVQRDLNNNGPMEGGWRIGETMPDGTIRVKKVETGEWKPVTKEQIINWNKAGRKKRASGGSEGRRSGAKKERTSSKNKNEQGRDSNSEMHDIKTTREAFKSAEGLNDIQRAKISRLEDGDILQLHKGMKLMDLTFDDIGKLGAKGLKSKYRTVQMKYHTDFSKRYKVVGDRLDTLNKELVQINLKKKKVTSAEKRALEEEVGLLNKEKGALEANSKSTNKANDIIKDIYNW